MNEYDGLAFHWEYKRGQALTWRHRNPESLMVVPQVGDRVLLFWNEETGEPLDFKEGNSDDDICGWFEVKECELDLREPKSIDYKVEPLPGLNLDKLIVFWNEVFNISSEG